MKARDVMTIIGAFCASMSTPLVALGTDKAAWWAGIVLGAIGSALLGSRAVMHDKDKKDKEP